MKSLSIALCQINPTLGDLEGNSKKILGMYRNAAEKYRPDLAVFPECALTGYPTEDLVLKRSFLKECERTLGKLAREVRGPAAVIGTALPSGRAAGNAAVLVRDGRVAAIYAKHILPNTGVFDEKRTFLPGRESGLVRVGGIRIGLSVCEDLWEEDPRLNPALLQARMGAEVLINISASPFYAGRLNDRRSLLRRRARQARAAIVYVNLVGGQDELVFDGRSLAADSSGRVRLTAPSFQEGLACAVFEKSGRAKLSLARALGSAPVPEGDEEIYRALVLGTRDYAEKNRFSKALVGLSGGIDSALTAAIAADALGPDRVIGVTMPSRFSSSGTRSDARTVAANLGIELSEIPIQGVFEKFLETLCASFRGKPPGVAEENLQSRIRGMILMALSNKFGHLVLTTGNKSEVSTGYCTLYGDTAGGFGVLKDVPKTLVYRLAGFLNRSKGRAVIPDSVIRRPPSAELREGQKDQDTLPPYDVLDGIIRGYVELDSSRAALLRTGFGRENIDRVLRMIDASEYKRRQSPPGIKITPRAFGRDRRMPITNRFREP